jgi:hypothetical protein
MPLLGRSKVATVHPVGGVNYGMRLEVRGLDRGVTLRVTLALDL